MIYQVSKIEGHKDKRAIEMDLLNRIPYKILSEKYDISASTLSKYYKEKMLPQWGKILKNERKQDVDLILNKMDKLANRCEKVLDACDRWLSDPETPEVYNLDPRANELDVIYTTIGEKGQRIRHKDSLQSLIEGIDVTKVISKSADPRELILKASKEIRESIKLIAEITGELSHTNSVLDVKVLMPTLLSIINNSTEKNLDIQKNIRNGLREIVDDAEREEILP